MPKYLVQVTMYFQLNVEAENMDEAESLVRNMDDAELYTQNAGGWSPDYEVFELDEEGELIQS